MIKKYLTIDIGGTFIKYSIMDEEYRILEEGSEGTRKNPEEFLKQLETLVLRYKTEVEGAAVCIAGFINPETGENTDDSVGENFRAYNLKQALSTAGDFPVILENDSNCAALGELVLGAGRGLRDFCLLTFGTGIGGALVLDGNLYRGKHFKAGEAGLTLLRYSMTDGKTSCESAGATSALVREVSRTLGRDVDGIYIFGHLDHPDILKKYNVWLEKAALVTGNTAMLLDPEAVLIGGGICGSPRFIGDLQKTVYHMFPQLEDYTEIRACETGNQAGRIGALSLFLKQAF